MNRILKMLSGAVSAVSLSLLSSTAYAEEIVLKILDHFPPAHFAVVQGIQPWMDRVTELTDGQVTFEYYPAEQLGKTEDFLRLSRAGAVDMTSVGGLMPLHLPLSTVVSIPAAGLTPTRILEAFWSLVSTDTPLRAEYINNGVEPLMFFANPSYEVMSLRRPLNTFEDLAGMRIRAQGGILSDIVRALDSVPIPIPAPEIYASLDRGVVEAVLLPYPSARSYRVDEVLRHGTDNLGLGSIITGYAMSTSKWESLPANVQEAIRIASEEYNGRVSGYQEQSNDADTEYFREQGMSVVSFGPEELSKLDEALEPLVELWIENYEAQNLPAREFYELWLDALAN